MSGLQTCVMMLRGSPVALAAQGHLLAVVWHAALPASPEDQCLNYTVYDVSQQQQQVTSAYTHACMCCTTLTATQWTRSS